jgi:hypothetical protein
MATKRAKCDACKKRKKRCSCKTSGVRQHVTVKIDQSKRGGSGKGGMPLIIPSGGGGPSVITMPVPSQPNYHDWANPSIPPLFNSMHHHTQAMNRSTSDTSNERMREAPSVHVPRANVVYDDFDIHVPRARVVDSPVDISVPRFNPVDTPYNLPNPVATQVDIPVQVPNFIRRETDVPVQTPNWIRNPVDVRLDVPNWIRNPINIPLNVPNLSPTRVTRGGQPSVPAIGDAPTDELGRNVARRRNRDDTPRLGAVPQGLLGNANPVFFRGVPRWLVDMPEVDQALQAGLPDLGLNDRRRALHRFVAHQPEFRALNLAGASQTDRNTYQMEYANRVIRAFFTQMGRTQLEAPPRAPPPALPSATAGQIVAHQTAGPIEEVRGLV